MRILLADDHALVREGLKSLLQQQGHTIVAEVDNAATIKSMVSTTSPDMLILDYCMPGGDVHAVASYVRKRYPHIFVIFLTGTQSGTALQKLAASGFHGLLLKQGNAAELMQAIQRVTAGICYISPLLEPYLDLPEVQLTARELQVLNMIINGMTRAEIATHLDVSTETVKSHRKNIMAKLGVHSVTEMYARAQELALV